MTSRAIMLLGIAATIGLTAVWHGPLGAGERIAHRIERDARIRLDRDEMHLVQAQVQRGPLARRLILRGPADDFQRGELVRRLDEIPGVLEVRWDPASLPQERRTAR